MSKTHVSAELLAAMGDLLASVKATTLDFETDDVERARNTRDEVADQLSDYILPRLVQLEAPLLTVVGGSTGAGKSTLVNSIVGQQVTESGVLRPTTRSPVLVHHPDDAEWFSRDRILPDLPRVGEADASVGYGLRLVATDAVPAGLAILDAPDVDSVDQINRELATQLLAAADLWLFVTSAARYADQVPWAYLKRAADRSTSLAVVLDRTADDAVEEVRGHLARMMTARGLADSPLFTVPEGVLSHTGLLPAASVAPIANWLRDLAADPAARRRVVGRTLDGAVRHIVFRAHDVADAVETQLEVARALEVPVDAAFETAREALDRTLTDGSLVAGEVDSRWRALLDDGLADALNSADGAVSTPIAGTRDLVDSVTSAIKGQIIAEIDRAAHSVGRAWAESPHGRSILSSSEAVDRVSADVRQQADRLADAWADALAEKISAVAAEVAVDRNVLAACAAVAAVSDDAADGGSARGGDARRLLAAALGEDGADGIIEEAAGELESLAAVLVDQDRARIELSAPTVDTIADQQEAVRVAARSAEYARHNDFINGEIAP